MRTATLPLIGRRPALRVSFVTVGLAAAVMPLAAAGQTSPRGVPSNRPDQNPTNARRSTAPAPRLITARNPDAPITPFTLTAVTIDGSSLPPGDLAAAWQPYVGRTIDNAQLSQLVTDLAAVYAKSDIALYSVLVPTQRFTGGAVRLVAVEGYIGAVEVRGKVRRNREKLLRAYLSDIQRERPLTKPTLQRYVSLIRDLPGFYPAIDLKTGDRQGAVRMEVTAKEKPIQLSIGINDRGTALLGRTQVQADLYVNAPFFGGDQLRLTTVLPTVVRRFQYYAGSYSAPLDADGTTLTLNGSYLRTRPASIPLKGNAVSFGAQISRPIIRSYDRNLYLTLGVDGIDSNNALLGLTLSNDRVRAVRLAASYQIIGKRADLTLSATASQGLDILGARVTPGISDGSFRKLNLKAVAGQKIGQAFVLRLDGFAQLTDDILPSSEQIALGGDEFGRAYEAAIIAGDYGYAGSAELAFRPAKLPKPVAGSEVYVFSDIGRTWYRGRLGFDTSSQHLASVGGGVRFAILSRAVIQVEAVRGLTNPVFYENRKKTRVLFTARTLF